jgi:hypothetical protein
MTDLLNYDTSWLNPALKLVNLGLFIFAAYIYFRTRRYYAGDIAKIIGLLLGMSIAGATATLLRYFGHGVEFGFTSEFSLKWFQSLGYVAQSILFLIAARQLSKGIIPEIRE